MEVLEVGEKILEAVPLLLALLWEQAEQELKLMIDEELEQDCHFPEVAKKMRATGHFDDPDAIDLRADLEENEGTLF